MITIKDIISLIISILGIILILILTYYCTRWLSIKTNLIMKSKYMNVVDRLMLGQNKFLVIAEINNKFYLLSIDENNIKILREFDDFQPLPDEKHENTIEFNKILDKFIKK